MNDAPIVIEPAQTATAAVLWMHGLGADGHDFEPVVPYLGKVNQYTRFIFPHAPVQPVTINSGMAMRAWYDIVSMDIDRKVDEAGVRQSEATALKLLNAQVAKGIPMERLVLAGFSQGGAIALHTGMRLANKLAGIMALSTYVVMPHATADEMHPANVDTEILMCHGTYDPVVPLKLAESGRDHLKEHGFKVRWHTYPMEHSVSPEELDDIGAWLSDQLPPV